MNKSFASHTKLSKSIRVPSSVIITGICVLVLLSLAKLFHKLEGGDCHDHGSLKVVVNESSWPEG